MSDFWFADDSKSMRYGDYLVEFNDDSTFTVYWYSDVNDWVEMERFKTMFQVAEYLKDA